MSESLYLPEEASFEETNEKHSTAKENETSGQRSNSTPSPDSPQTMHAIIFFLFLLALIVQTPTTMAVSSIRSRAISVARTWTNVLVGSAAPFVLLKQTEAREGAFEMDLRFYVRDLVNGGKEVPNTEKRKPMFKSPRKLNDEIASGIVNVVAKEISSISGVPSISILQNVTATMPVLLAQFQPYVPFRELSLSDQYYFDIYLYGLYEQAAILIPLSSDRVILRKNIGNGILSLLKTSGRLKVPTSSTNGNSKNEASMAAAKMGILATGVEAILKIFSDDAKLIDGYLFDVEDVNDAGYAEGSFNEVSMFLIALFVYSISCPVSTHFAPFILVSSSSCRVFR